MGLTKSFWHLIEFVSDDVLAYSIDFVSDDVLAYSKPQEFDWKAAPWWVQKEEAAKRKCESSCTLNSRGVNTKVNLCDDKEVGSKIQFLNEIL
jgi:hypothetical protein